MKRKLNFGCGTDIKKGWDNCDKQEGKGIITFNADDFPYPIKNNTYDYILLRQSLDFVEDVRATLFELWRISKPGAEIKIEVPYYNNRGAFNDVESKHFFSDNTFKIFVEETCIVNKQKKFQIEGLVLTPTIIGKFLPKCLRNKISMILPGLISQIHVKLRVMKNG